MPTVPVTMDVCFPAEVNVTVTFKTQRRADGLRAERLNTNRLKDNVDASVYTRSLTVGNFVTFQQFMSDWEKLDYQRDIVRDKSDLWGTTSE